MIDSRWVLKKKKKNHSIVAVEGYKSDLRSRFCIPEAALLSINSTLTN